ncbi:MAG: 5-carboxymethyl-2-hydroxymuconate isomerase [SAR324 cluster bacterium]|nr:5-carboxymethyl-2-hydroxymuconate isomerase [SAR324 cluster bacterium]
MPHLIIECSANLEGDLDIQAFCEHLRQTATEIDAFPLAGVRVRAFVTRYYSIADGNPKHCFIDISVRLRAGRPMDVRKAAAEKIFEAAKTYLNPLMTTRSIALSLEMRDIDPELSPKTSTIREHL